MKKIQLFFVMLFLGCLTAAAQSLTVTGRVTQEDDGSPLVGATIYVKGTNIAQISDVNGAYKITIPAGVQPKILVFSFTGLQTKEVTVLQSGIIDVALLESSQSIDEVIVVGYGTSTRKAFTGTASVVKSDDIKNLQIATITGALQGMASGVISVNSSGQPGSSPDIRIRGIGSFSASSEPLIVLDGIPYNGSIASINPNDVESITVNKDANSTALYGSQAANGVIQIVTKSGRLGKTSVNVTALMGCSSRAVRDYDYLGAEDYMKLTWQSLHNSAKYEGAGGGLSPGAYASNNLIPTLIYNPYGPNHMRPVDEAGNIVEGAKLLYDQDWYKALTQMGKRQEYQVSVNGGVENIRYLISLGVLDEKAILAKSQYTRYSSRIKVDTRPTKWLAFGLNQSLTYSYQNTPLQSGSYLSNVIAFVRRMSSIYPAYQMDKDGGYVLDAQGDKIPDYGEATHPGTQPGNRPVSVNSNPLGTTLLNIDDNTRLMTNSALYGEVQFLKDFKLRSQLGVEYNLLNESSYSNPLVGDGKSYKGRSDKRRRIDISIAWINTLTWDKTFGDHHVNVLIGTSSQDYSIENMSAERKGFEFSGVTQLGYAANIIGANSDRTATRSMSYLARANYDYMNRYHLSLSATKEGTSVFMPQKRWGLFYSVGAAWNVNYEPFWQGISISEWFNNLKVRFSWGTSGNSSVGYFPYMTTYQAGGSYIILKNMSSIVGALGNRNLGWETQKQLDLGLDLGFLNNNITASITYFDRHSDGLLMSRPLPPSSGYTSIKDNVGEIRNYGLEFDFSARAIQRENFTWTIGFNISQLTNRIISLPDYTKKTDGTQSGIADGHKWFKEGGTRYSWYVKEWAGVDAKTGKPQWWKNVYEKDANGNDVIGADGLKVIKERVPSDNANADYYFAGESLPKMMGGINTQFVIYGVEISAIGSFAVGGKILDYDYANLMHGFSANKTGCQSVQEAKMAWKNPGDITDVPYLSRTSYSFDASSTRWLVDGSYFRLRNLTVGYDLARIAVVKGMGLRQAKLYCTMDNLITIFGTRGLDPEPGLGGAPDNKSSLMKTISFGLNLSF